MTTVIIKGKKETKDEFRKEFNMDIKEMDLHGNQLTQVDLSPIQECQELQRLWLHENQLT